MLIRHVNKDDLGKIQKINEQVQLYPWSEKQVLGEIQNATRYSLVALDRAEQLAGYLFARAVGEDFEITSIGVDQKSQKKGIGRGLLKALFDLCQPHSNIFLEVSEKNKSAIDFYKAIGFEQIGERPRYYPDGASAFLFKLNLAKT